MHESVFLGQTVLLFAAALFVAWLFRIVRAPAVIGFLVAGVLIGPSGFRLITQDAVAEFAELGLVMLLFSVGLELSTEPMLRAGRAIVSASALQIAATGVIVLGVLLVAGSVPLAGALALAAAVALSSTAIVLKQLSDRGQTGSPAGLLISGILLLQDVFVILLMLFLPVFAAAGGADWRSSLLRAVVATAGLAGVTFLVRRLLPFLLHQAIRWGGQEFTALFAVLTACAGAWLAGKAGWSWALGACIAGLLLSQTDLRHQLFAEIMPFRDVFNALFFISMGMLVDLGDTFHRSSIVLPAIGATLLGKTVITTLCARASGWPVRLAVHAGLGLCTVSEFSYVFVREAARLGLLPDGVLETFTAYAVGTMMAGAMLVPVADRLSHGVARALGRPMTTGPLGGEGPADHVIVVGFGLNGQNLARVLRATGIPFSLVEMNRVLAGQARADGCRVILGDAARRSILFHAGLPRARALVIAINDIKATRRIVAQARADRGDLYILARTRYTAEIETLHRLGAQQVIPEEFETSVEIFAHVLKHFAIPDNVIQAQIALIRAGNYAMLRGRPGAVSAREDVLAFLEATATQTFLVQPGSPACGRSLRDLNLRALTGVTVIAVVRRGRPCTNPAADFTLDSGDILVLVGGHQALASASSMLSPPAAEPGAVG